LRIFHSFHTFHGFRIFILLSALYKFLEKIFFSFQNLEVEDVETYSKNTTMAMDSVGAEANIAANQ
jgi:hypothetical protein